MLIHAMENICRNVQYKICTKYAIISKICSHEICMQNMQKFALPTC